MATDLTAPPATSAAPLDFVKIIRKVLKPLASLQLTVTLFAFAILLVFFGTVAQKNASTWTVVSQYFWSWGVWVELNLLLQFGQIFFSLPTSWSLGGGFPLPGGKLVGGLMFVNLLAAHTVRFRLTWKRLGIFLIHGGILLLFLGEFITREYQVEQQMAIPTGGSADFAIDSRHYELAFIDTSDPKVDGVTVVPMKMIQQAVRSGTRIAHPDLPADMAVLKYLPNARLESNTGPNIVDAGYGVNTTAVEEPEASGVDSDKKQDFPTAYVRFFRKGTDEALGTYLVSLAGRSQPATFDGVKRELQVRNTHYYKPYRIELLQFTFERYIGTKTPKNFASRVVVHDPLGGDRETTIAMNEPLRFRGETFYQSGVLPGETGTVLQVVRNPGWLIPYISCGVVTLGLLLHFGVMLRKYLGRVTVPTVAPSDADDVPADRGSGLARALPWVTLGVAVLLVANACVPRRGNGLDLSRLARLPVVDGGRMKPLDTVARVNMRLVSNRETCFDNVGQKHSAIQWLVEVLASAEARKPAHKAWPVVRIENEELWTILNVKWRDGLRYSLDEILPKAPALMKLAADASDRKERGETLAKVDVKAMELAREITAVFRLANEQDPLLLPPSNGKAWRTPAQVREAAGPVVLNQMLTQISAVTGKTYESADEMRRDIRALSAKQQDQIADAFAQASQQAAEDDPAFKAWQTLLAAYRADNQEKLDSAVAAFAALDSEGLSANDLRRVQFETFLNESALFYQCTYLYVLAFLLCAGSWVALSIDPALGRAWRRSAVRVLLFTFAIHGITLLARMYLMDRPLVFVTNLYSTAVFIGWGAVGAGLLIERYVPIGLGSAIGAVIGFATSILAHNLAASGDTLEMMVAVLDTNFWLATHVTTINLGYSATYLAGAVGIAYILIGVFTPNLRRPMLLGGKPTDLGKSIGQVLYGVLCLATILSFVGTVLGGIWGDQSWGRFWGWDPKENGAILIVLWNALILHARWAGLVKDRGTAVLTLGGNMITTWSYFGTNQLGVGLHNYGFDNTLAMICSILWILHLGLIALGWFVPLRFWGSAVPAKTTT